MIRNPLERLVFVVAKSADARLSDPERFLYSVELAQAEPVDRSIRESAGVGSGPGSRQSADRQQCFVTHRKFREVRPLSRDQPTELRDSADASS